MASGSLLALLDDIAAVLDDVAVMSKVAAKKTAGVLGDDLALNAQQVTGVKADRELPVVWAVAKGSLLNKTILVPAALLISALLPWAITPLLMLGGAFLCFEGAEKLHHVWRQRNLTSRDKAPQAAINQHGNSEGSDSDRSDSENAVFESSEFESSDFESSNTRDINLNDLDLQAYEKKKIQGAVRTDFILSAEIIAITLGVVAQKNLLAQFSTLTVIALAMTVGVYGLVALIVKIDDAGLYLAAKEGAGLAKAAVRKCGFALLRLAPWLMKALSVVGTAAMFMVGGGILVHGVHALAVYIEQFGQALAAVSIVGPALSVVTPTLVSALLGLLAGFIILIVLRMVGIVKAH